MTVIFEIVFIVTLCHRIVHKSTSNITWTCAEFVACMNSILVFSSYTSNYICVTPRGWISPVLLSMQKCKFSHILVKVNNPQCGCTIHSFVAATASCASQHTMQWVSYQWLMYIKSKFKAKMHLSILVRKMKVTIC